MKDVKEFIIKQYKNKKRVLDKNQIKFEYTMEKDQSSRKVFLISLKSPSNSCGDEIDFLVWKDCDKIKKINFSNDDCCIITAAAANIVSDYLEKNYLPGEELKFFIDNVEKMINGKHYDKDKVKDFEYFSGVENIYSRNECIKIVIKFVRKVV